ncbi:CD209a antigen (predicted), isoform CRA_a [Rattus norvegicus]|uniref:CD209a antigen (Predicted), isoform CRA_a n=2 Tax=Rattus norvegicus TaxID=10116 RepID=A6KQ41_RAT|nr:CD209a molecule [Rattus norvegicus]EDL74965.1 CD209a antigen (predicted), isoform CRA_a [Rattus norvegicus]|eukprot:NP_001099374.1 CD209a molecule [Rattus norvegicus]
MSESKETGKQQLGPLDEELLTSSHTRYSMKGFGFQPNSGFSSFTGYLVHSHVPLALKALFLTVFSVLLVVILVKVYKIPSSHEQEESNQKNFYQELIQLKAGVDRLCRSCPWDWTAFQGNCYFFSVAQKSWNDSATACHNVGAQLVVIKSEEEQNFLQKTSKKRGYTWMGLIDINKESTWHWVDGSPLTLTFMKYWNKGEPNNVGDKDCAEFREDGWNDTKCDNKKFWICKKPETSCSSK